MSIKKWLMKQYWRIGTIRALASLALGMLVLGRQYLQYVPFLRDMGIFGAITLGSGLFFIFLGLGWLYDIKARMWSQQLQVAVERNPFQYIPNDKTKMRDYPVIYCLVDVLTQLLEKLNLSSKTMKDLSGYLEDYFFRETSRSDIFGAEHEADLLLRKYPFKHDKRLSEREIPVSSKAKLAWETQILRLNWIQSLTGLLQDVLVFGVLYVSILFPWVPESQTLLYGIGAISLPFLAILLFLGWIYDRKLAVWSAEREVIVYRNPYSYVLKPSEKSFNMPLFYCLFDFFAKVSSRVGAESNEIQGLSEYLRKYIDLKPSNNEDLEKAEQLRDDLDTLFVGIQDGE